MKNKYFIITFITAITIVLYTSVSFAVVNDIKSIIDSTKTTIKLKDSRPNRPTFLPPIAADFQSFMIKVSAIKSINTPGKSLVIKNNKSVSASVEIQKPLDNVRIYPNPISTHINIAYTLSKENQVTVKILDVLGNEVVTLLSQKVAAGEQLNSFNLNTKLSSGLYFVRVVAGSESIIKRISVL
ncbi:T9SS type A sorting domain-containing protein [Pedobacter glucosidilyticus]|uniref:T9SS type A sorting domain-containing protein n=1 Tax=Pedobacter glucosidilyticus TaxID=1122941 RepID=UPI0026ED2800|nr:T9SS type A sorting domain-containing protein [Pedobacter glucosidilyticus]